MTTKTVKGRVGLHRDRWHRYAWNNSGWQPGATSILKVQDALTGSDGLIRWATKIAAEAAYNAAIRPESADFGTALSAAIAAVDGARDRGTRIHGGIEAQIGDLEHVPTPEDGAIWYGWSAFLVREKPEIHASEQMVIDLTHGYGGTFDLDCTVRGKRSLVDIKTGDPKPAHALQLAAYAGAEWMGAPDDPEKHPLPEFERFYVLSLKDKAPYYQLIPLTVGTAEVDYFHYLAKTYHTLKAWTTQDASEEAAA